MNYFFTLKDFVDKSTNDKILDSDKLSNEFQDYLKQNFTDAQFSVLLMSAGFIPDLYGNDSSEETLYSKLVEVLVCEWAERMGFTGEYVKTMASYEDVSIKIVGGAIVCDAKSFRLGRSQKAPNVKDFLKLEDIRKWLARYENKIGGLVTYPDTHEWKDSSDAYQYCSTKDAPTVMLPYKYLALLLNFKDNYKTESLKTLWDYDRIFPESLKKAMEGGNKKAYWNAIDKEILQITKITKEEFNDFMTCANSKIDECIHANLNLLEIKRASLVANIKSEVDKLDKAFLRQSLTEFRIKSETKVIDQLIGHIHDFRL